MLLYIKDLEYWDGVAISGGPSEEEYRYDEVEQNVFCVGYSGILDLPETDIEPVEKTYSDGVAFPPRTRRRGQSFTVDLLATELRGRTGYGSVVDDYELIKDLVSRGTVDVDIEADPVYFSAEAQCQSIEVLKDTTNTDKKAILFRLYFVGNSWY